MYVPGYTWWYGYRNTFIHFTNNGATDRDSVYSCIIYFTVFYLYICGIILPAFMLLCMYCAFIRMLYFVRKWRNKTDQSINQYLAYIVLAISYLQKSVLSWIRTVLNVTTKTKRNVRNVKMTFSWTPRKTSARVGFISMPHGQSSMSMITSRCGNAPHITSHLYGETTGH